MSHVADIEYYVNDPARLLNLCREVLEHMSETQGNNAAAMEAQLREISRTIDRLTKLNVPVPEVLRAEKTRLAAALGTCNETEQPLKLLLDGLEELLHKAKSRSPYSSDTRAPKRTNATHSKSPKTHRMILRKLILEGLSAFGGTADKRELYKKIGEF